MGGGKEGLIDRSQVLTDYACATRSQLQQAIPHLQTSTARWRAARLWGQATCCARASARTYTHAHTQTRARAHAHCRSLQRPRPRLAHSCQGTAGEAGRGAPNRSLAGGVHCPPQPTVQVHSVPHKVTPTTASQNPPVASRQQSHQNVQGGLLPPPNCEVTLHQKTSGNHDDTRHQNLPEHDSTFHRCKMQSLAPTINQPN